MVKQFVRPTLQMSGLGFRLECKFLKLGLANKLGSPTCAICHLFFFINLTININ